MLQSKSRKYFLVRKNVPSRSRRRIEEEEKEAELKK
jgi:hypothetical protein